MAFNCHLFSLLGSDAVPQFVCLMTLTILKSIANLFCRHLQFGFAWHLLTIKLRLCILGGNTMEAMLLPYSVRQIRSCVMSKRIITDGVHFDHLVKVVSAFSSTLMLLTWVDKYFAGDTLRPQISHFSSYFYSLFSKSIVRQWLLPKIIRRKLQVHLVSTSHSLSDSSRA